VRDENFLGGRKAGSPSSDKGKTRSLTQTIRDRWEKGRARKKRSCEGREKAEGEPPAKQSRKETASTEGMENPYVGRQKGKVEITTLTTKRGEEERYWTTKTDRREMEHSKREA